MKKQKLFIMALLATSFLTSVSCQNNKKQNDNQQTNIAMSTSQSLPDFDSLLTSYKTMPVYYVDYGNTDCMFELRVNDIVVDQLTRQGRIGGTSATINSYIFKSGKQKVSLKLYPNPGQTMIKSSTNNRYPYFKPFEMNINYIDFKLSDDQQSLVDVYTMPDIVTPKEGIPYYEFETEFEANVPYKITTYDNCIDLRELPDIEKRVVAEFERVRQLMIDQKFEELKTYYRLRDIDAAVSMYQSNETVENNWNDDIASILKAAPSDWQAIEDYRIEFGADGRSVTLRSEKLKGFPSALLWIKDKEKSYQFVSFELHLAIKKGSDEFAAVVA